MRIISVLENFFNILIIDLETQDSCLKSYERAYNLCYLLAGKLRDKRPEICHRLLMAMIQKACHLDNPVQVYIALLRLSKISSSDQEATAAAAVVVIVPLLDMAISNLIRHNLIRDANYFIQAFASELGTNRQKSLYWKTLRYGYLHGWKEPMLAMKNFKTLETIYHQHKVEEDFCWDYWKNVLQAGLQSKDRELVAQAVARIGEENLCQGQVWETILGVLRPDNYSLISETLKKNTDLLGNDIDGHAVLPLKIRKLFIHVMSNYNNNNDDINNDRKRYIQSYLGLLLSRRVYFNDPVIALRMVSHVTSYLFGNNANNLGPEFTDSYIELLQDISMDGGCLSLPAYQHLVQYVSTMYSWKQEYLFKLLRNSPMEYISLPISRSGSTIEACREHCQTTMILSGNSQ